MASLVLMTKPVPGDGRPPAERAMGYARAAFASARELRFGRRGPQAVMGSLTRGLSSLDVDFDLNPRQPPKKAVLGVLSDLKALAQAIDWRRQGRVTRLVAGPNLVVLPSDATELMSSPEIDLCVVPSGWVKELYEQDCSMLRGRLAVWPAGVDCAYWSPAEHDARRSRRAVLFRKVAAEQVNASDEEIETACNLLRSLGYEVMRLEYGNFSRHTYRRILRMCDIGVVFGSSESQGIALAEAWSVGLPTLVWSRERFKYRGRTYTCSAAPYLSEETGAFFCDIDELESLLDRWDNLAMGFDPRGWVIRNMTDEICAHRYRALIQGQGASWMPTRSAFE